MDYSPKIVYSPNYDIHFYGVERLHPFDSRKYSHAWKVLKGRFGKELAGFHVPIQDEISRQDLCRVHSESYLKSLSISSNTAAALEMPVLHMFPQFLLDRHILKPMRLATMGTVTAAGLALNHGFTVNLSGGYHHASKNRGEGFCIYNDIMIAIESLRFSGKLNKEDRILYIDLDAHQGNGVAKLSIGDESIVIFDMYNHKIYPHDKAALGRVDYSIGLSPGTDDEEYIRTLKSNLNGVISRNHDFKLAVYNAGTDVFVGDALGGLGLSEQGVLARDRFVIETLKAHGIPCVMLASGGYSSFSYQLIANSIIDILGGGSYEGDIPTEHDME